MFDILDPFGRYSSGDVSSSSSLDSGFSVRKSDEVRVRIQGDLVNKQCVTWADFQAWAGEGRVIRIW